MKADDGKPGVFDAAAVIGNFDRGQTPPSVAPDAARRHFDPVEPELDEPAEIVGVVEGRKGDVGNGKLHVVISARRCHPT